jgi:hypothetical protein
MGFEKGNQPWNKAVGNQRARKHGLNTLKRLLEGPKVDGRTSLYRVLREKEREFADALGGDPSPQQRCIINDAVKTMLYIGTLDEYLMSLDGGIVKGGKVIPVVETRTQLAAHLRRDLEALGLERRAKDADDLPPWGTGETVQPSGNRGADHDESADSSAQDGQDGANATGEADSAHDDEQGYE